MFCKTCFQNFQFLSLKSLVSKGEVWVILVCKIQTKFDLIHLKRRIKNKHGTNCKENCKEKEKKP